MPCNNRDPTAAGSDSEGTALTEITQSDCTTTDTEPAPGVTAVNDDAQSEPDSLPSGHCMCGGVSYEVHGPIRQVWNCHCWRCRRWTGHYMAGTGCKRSDLRFTSDATLAWHHPADDPNVAYGFCRECGGSVFWKVMDGPPDQTDHIAICAGTLDLPTGLHTERALFVDDAADYHSLDPAVAAWSRE